MAPQGLSMSGSIPSPGRRTRGGGARSMDPPAPAGPVASVVDLDGGPDRAAAQRYADAVHRVWTRDFWAPGRYGAVVDAVPGPVSPAGPLLPVEVEVRRSRRRHRTVTAYRDGSRIVVLIPAPFSASQEREWVHRMVERLSAQERRRRPADRELMARAVELSRRYLGGLARPRSITWVDNQRARWGSCTPADGTIRLSSRLRGMPRWVIDYVILHELSHLLEQGHGPRFWELLDAYPRTERARGFLDGFAAARELQVGAEADEHVGPEGAEG